jgi:hypothetical protein
METWNEIFTAIILPLLVALMGLAIAWINKKKSELSAKIKNDAAQKYFDLATDAVLKAVQYTTQTYVDSLKKSGAFTKEAQQEAFERAKLLASTMINQSAKDIITEAYGDFNTWITTQIEATVKETKVVAVKIDNTATV